MTNKNLVHSTGKIIGSKMFRKSSQKRAENRDHKKSEEESDNSKTPTKTRKVHDQDSFRRMRQARWPETEEEMILKKVTKKGWTDNQEVK